MLRDALESLRAQTRPPEEVVVVDNASTDDTESVARSFGSDLNLKLIRENNVGIPHARNRALEACTGDIVAVMDDDCVADPRWLAEIERPFLKDPRIGAVGGSLVPLEGGGRGLINRFYNDRMRDALAALETGDR